MQSRHGCKDCTCPKRLVESTVLARPQMTAVDNQAVGVKTAPQGKHADLHGDVLYDEIHNGGLEAGFSRAKSRGLTATLDVNCCASTSGFGPVDGSGKLSCPSMVFFARVCTCVTSEEEACMEGTPVKTHLWDPPSAVTVCSRFVYTDNHIGKQNAYNQSGNAYAAFGLAGPPGSTLSVGVVLHILLQAFWGCSPAAIS